MPDDLDTEAARLAAAMTTTPPTVDPDGRGEWWPPLPEPR